MPVLNFEECSDICCAWEFYSTSLLQESEFARNPYVRLTKTPIPNSDICFDGFPEPVRVPLHLFFRDRDFSWH